MKICLFILFSTCMILRAQEWNVDIISDWQEKTDTLENLDIMDATDWGGVIDLMGNGALLLQKINSDSLYMRTSEFYSNGQWISGWYDFGSETLFIDDISFLSSIQTGIENQKTVNITNNFYLYHNFPNPFNPSTRIRYFLPSATKVELALYDILGREVERLVNSKQPAGIHEVQFDGSALASGIYIYSISTGSWTYSKKMLLLNRRLYAFNNFLSTWFHNFRI